MKYDYYICASGNADEEAIYEKLQQLKLSVIFVEKHVNLDSVIGDQNNARDENFEVKWQALCETDLIPEAMKTQVGNIMKGKMKSMQNLARAIHTVGTELGMTDSSISRLLGCVFQFWKEQ